MAQVHLSPPHTGQSLFEYGPKGSVGFRFIRCSNIGGNLKVGNLAAPQCTFRNCEYGITSAYSFFTTENARFEEIIGSSAFGGYGIYGEYGYNKVENCSFFHCNTGVYQYKMNFLVDGCDISTCTQGVFAWKSRYYVSPSLSLPTVKNCNINNILNGIVFFQNDDSNPQVFDNTISRAGVSGISVFDITGLPNRSYIHSNTIILSGGGWPNGISDGSGIGIRLTTTRNPAVCRNTIDHSPDGDQAICISADGSTLATITNNTLALAPMSAAWGLILVFNVP